MDNILKKMLVILLGIILFLTILGIPIVIIGFKNYLKAKKQFDKEWEENREEIRNARKKFMNSSFDDDWFDN